MNLKIAAWIYIVAACLTFGYATNRGWEWSHIDQMTRYEVRTTDSENIWQGIAAGLVWPMYWPYELMRPLRK